MADKFRMIRLGMPPELAQEVAGQIDDGGGGGQALTVAVRADGKADTALVEVGEAQVTADNALVSATPVIGYAAALALSGVAFLQRISAMIDGRLVEWVRQTGGTCLGGGWVPAWLPHPSHWNATLNGIADDTTAIRAMHTYSNLTGIEPDYSGVRTFAVQADSKIFVNTSVNWRGARPVALNGLVPAPSWSLPFNEMFIAEDLNRPVVSGEMDVIGANFAEGSYLSCRGLIPSPGWLMYYLNEGTNLPRRALRDAGTGTWRLTQKVYKDLRTQYPMPVDASGVTRVYREYRLNSDRPIVLENMVFNIDGVNQQRLIHCKRNQVTIRNITFESTNPLEFSISLMLSATQCSDFHVDKIEGFNPNMDDNFLGTYIFYLDKVADLKVTDCDIRGGTWASMASFFCNGLSFRDCHLIRIDAHDYVANWNIQDCELYERGVSIGEGAGTLTIRNTKFFMTRSDFYFVASRPDYGKGSWRGSVLMDNCTIVTSQPGGTLGVAFIDLWGQQLGNTEMPMHFPSSIMLRNCHVEWLGPDPTLLAITGVGLRVNPAMLGVYAPAQVVVDGISCNRPHLVKNILDLGSCLLPSTGVSAGTSVSIRNLESTYSSAAQQTLSIPARSAAPSADFRIEVKANGIPYFTADLQGGVRIGNVLQVAGGHASRLTGANGWHVTYTGTDFSAPRKIGAEVAAPIANTQDGSRFTSINGGRLAAFDFDLAPVSLINGLAIRQTLDPVYLPSGCTRELAGTGWRKTNL